MTAARGEERKVGVVTGARTGLGHATAEALLRRGWRVIAVSRDPERSSLAARRFPEIAGASTKAFLAQITACYILGLHLAQLAGETYACGMFAFVRKR